MSKNLFVVVGLLLSASLAFAQGPKGGHGRDKRDFWKHKDFKELNLNEDQKAKIKEIRESSKDKFKALKKEMKTQAEALREELKGNASKEVLTKSFSQLQDKRKELATLKFSQMLQIREILTPEQKQKIADKMTEFREFRRGGPHDDGDDE